MIPLPRRVEPVAGHRTRPSLRARTAAGGSGLLLCAFLLGCGAPEAPPAAERRPDVVLFVVDTLRKDHLSCYGYPRPTSPTIDRLAEEGALFLDPVAQCSWTKPSMVSLFNGRYVTEYRDLFFEGAPTLAESFEAAGYRTLGVVGNVLLSPENGFDRGFQHYDARRNEDPDRHKGELGRPLQALARDLWPHLERALEPEEGGERPPLFVYVHAMDPHNPYLPHSELDGELSIADAEPYGEWHRERFAEGGAPPPGDDPGWRKAWKRMQIARGRYDQEIRHTDTVMEDMLERLRGYGLLDHAVVGLVADHGEVLYGHQVVKRPETLARSSPQDFFHKEHGVYQYQSLIGTPFLLWGSGVPAGTVVEDSVENVDLYPTLMDLVGLPKPDGLHGRSLVPLLEGAADEGREFVYSFVMQNRSVREVATNLKLVLPTELGARAHFQPALYDLDDDPEERVNLHDQRPDDVARLTAALEAWCERFPTETTLGRNLDPQERADLEGLGYLGGEDEDSGDDSGE